jgi:molybdopterin synthase catalytic subunit
MPMGLDRDPHLPQGMATIRVQSGPFEIGHELATLTAGRTDIGGIGSFIGTVRDHARDGAGISRPIAAMTLEHYPGMTEQAMARIAARAMERWQLLGCTLIHRVGELAPGEGIVLVLAAAPHRQAALEATGFLIDWLKTRAPFWKKERFVDGTEQWVDARETDEAAAGRWG